jgi:hypothetical protein
MCIYGIFRDDLGFYYFQRRETTRSKKNTRNSKHATTLKSLTNSNIQWDGTFLHMFYKTFATIMAPISKLTKKTKIFLWIEKCQKV